VKKLIEVIGAFTVEILGEAGRTGVLFFQSITTLRGRPYYTRVWFEQMLEVGVRSLPIVVVTSVFSGAVFAMQT
jgi:phospholipid/cholesterol/gamma-HCH transport system permease protein